MMKSQVNEHSLKNSSAEYVALWWESIRDAKGSCKKVRLESDRMTLELLRAFQAGWNARMEPAEKGQP